MSTAGSYVRDALSGRRYVLTPPGADRKPNRAAMAAAPCPFCWGAEQEQPGHRRVPTTSGPVSVHDNPFPLIPGRHHVVLLADDHQESAVGVTADAWARLLEVGAQTQRRHPDAWPLLGANLGPLGAASVAHAHAQVLTLPEPAPACLAERDSLSRPRDCALCTTAPFGTAVHAAGGAQVVVPHHGAEVVIAPQDHLPGLGHGTAPVAQLIAWVWSKLADQGWTDGQVSVHHLPEAFHWHVHVTPMLGPFGCLERGSGMTFSRLLPAALEQALRP